MPVVVASDVVVNPVRAFGGFSAVALDTFVALFKPRFAFRQFIAQSWCLHRPESGRLPQRPTSRSAFAIGGAAAYRSTERR